VAKKKRKSEKNTKISKSNGGKKNFERRLFDNFNVSFPPSPWQGVFGNHEVWVPLLHVFEKQNNFVIRVDLPGVHEEDLSVSILGDILVVEGEEESESTVKKKSHSYKGTACSNFSRSILIPSIVDIAKIEANFRKGVLEILLPKTAGIQPKKVKVTAEKILKPTVKEEPNKGNSEMEKFLFVYYGGNVDSTPAEQKKSIGAWMDWFKKQGKAVVEAGNPITPCKLVTSKGIKAISGKIVTGYSIFQAADINAAIKIAKTSPQMDGGEIAIYSIMAIM